MRIGAAEPGQANSEIFAISALGDWECSLCGAGGELLKMEDGGPVCLSCADLDHLDFLPRGDAAMTRRSRRASDLSAVVVRWSRARRRYERQGILAEPEAIERAEAECLADEEQRSRRREREAVRRAEQDTELQREMAAAIRREFPGSPPERAEQIAAHTATRGSGRVGRSAAGRGLESGAIELAVRASIRHRETDYDELLMAGLDRAEARERIHGEVDEVLARWRDPPES